MSTVIYAPEKKPLNSIAVSFTPPRPALKRKESERGGEPLSANNLTRDQSNVFLLTRKDSIVNSGTKFETAELNDKNICRYQRKWRTLSYLQIVFGLKLFCVDLYSHFPVFSCGWVLSAGADWLWFGTWLGILNFLTGVIGGVARLADLSYSSHKFFRRKYFLLNCAFVPFANGIGLASFGITLSSVALICNENVALKFTAVMAFISFILLLILILLNVLGVAFQVCATSKCRCWVCDPRNQSSAGIIRS